MNRALTSTDVTNLLRSVGLEGMDEDLFTVTVRGYDPAGFPFGTIEDADDGTILHHYGWMYDTYVAY